MLSLTLSCSWEVFQDLGFDHLQILLTVSPSLRSFAPTNVSFPSIFRKLVGMTLLFTLILTILILVSFFFFCCCFLYFFDTECPPYDLVLRMDGSVPFPFGKGGSSLLANCSLCGTEASLFYSAGPVCSSFSAEACAILQALCWSRQHQQVCQFSSPI